MLRQVLPGPVQPDPVRSLHQVRLLLLRWGGLGRVLQSLPEEEFRSVGFLFACRVLLLGCFGTTFDVKRKTGLAFRFADEYKELCKRGPGFGPDGSGPDGGFLTGKVLLHFTHTSGIETQDQGFCGVRFTIDRISAALLQCLSDRWVVNFVPLKFLAVKDTTYFLHGLFVAFLRHQRVCVLPVALCERPMSQHDRILHLQLQLRLRSG